MLDTSKLKPGSCLHHGERVVLYEHKSRVTPGHIVVTDPDTGEVETLPEAALEKAPPWAGATKIGAVYIDRWLDGTYKVSVVRPREDGTGYETASNTNRIPSDLLPDALDGAASIVLGLVKRSR